MGNRLGKGPIFSRIFRILIMKGKPIASAVPCFRLRTCDHLAIQAGTDTGFTVSVSQPSFSQHRERSTKDAGNVSSFPGLYTITRYRYIRIISIFHLICNTLWHDYEKVPDLSNAGFAAPGRCLHIGKLVMRSLKKPGEAVRGEMRFADGDAPHDGIEMGTMISFCREHPGQLMKSLDAWGIAWNG